MRVGVLALQGDWAAHLAVLEGIGLSAEPVRTASQLARADALVLPGGESTAMLRLMEAERLDLAIAERVRGGMPVLATCAGVILLARGVEPRQPSLDVLDIDVVRNAYGRQIHSSVTAVEANGALGGAPTLEAVFIRAPRIVRTGPAVQVLARLAGDPVLVADGPVLAATFHPELAPDRRVHRLFVRRLEASDA